MRLHDDGKASLDHIYTQDDPRGYFSTLRKLDYTIPQQAKPHFLRLIRQLRATQVVDIGSSYGVNAALLRCDLTMDALFDRYGGADACTRTRAALLADDRAMVVARDRLGVRFVGLDVAAGALAYGRAAGFLDDTVQADLERADPTPDQRARLAGTDLVISTGCLGYVTERTVLRVARAADRPPWMAHFVLRMYPFEPVAEGLADLGYRTVRDDRYFRQRLFATPQERAQVLDTLRDQGIDPSGRETDGWLYAQLFISCPPGA